MVNHVAVLGAGLMGAATALFVARRGVRVTLFDAADQPLARASRWNEGKIHLGYLYAGDPSLDTARRILPGGLAFKRLTEELIGCSLHDVVTSDDDTFLVHRDSVTSAEEAARYFRAVTALAESHADARGYLAPLTGARVQRLSPAELDAHYDTADIVAGYRVPERSVSTRWVADRVGDALAADPGIELRMRTLVRGVRRSGSASDAPVFVDTATGTDGPFDVVVNALWENRPSIDATIGLPAPPIRSHRYRLSAFLRTSRTVDAPSAVITTGPFGDIKNYNGRDFYLSWYLSGLVAEGTAIAPPPLPSLGPADRVRIVDEIMSRLGRIVRAVGTLRDCAEDVRLEGGWVYAAGQGSLSDRASTIHRRDHIGITRVGSYISVDTGKYSIAPWLAREVAMLIR